MLRKLSLTLYLGENSPSGEDLSFQQSQDECAVYDKVCNFP